MSAEFLNFLENNIKITLKNIHKKFLHSSRELREIYTEEEDEIEFRAKKAKAKEDEERLSSSFVEWLNEHQLFENLWDGDEDGAALCQIGDEADELVKEYRNDTYNLTQEIYKMGLLRFEERKQEIELFEKSVKIGKEVIQKAGQKLVNNFLDYKVGVFRKAMATYRNIERANLVEGKDQFNSVEVKAWVDNVRFFQNILNKFYNYITFFPRLIHFSTILRQKEMICGEF